MQSIEILDIRPFMQLFFQTDGFSSYEFVSGELRTDMTYHLDGHLNKSFFSEEELEANDITSAYLPWQLAKEKVFSLIKGKKTPTQMKIVLKANQNKTAILLSESGTSLTENDIDAMYLNIMFQENKLYVTCGISYKIFTLNKELENSFSNHITTFFKSNGIVCDNHS